MQIPFEIGDDDLILHWHSGKNQFELETLDEVIPLNTWWHPSQQLGMRRRRVWTHDWQGHRIEVEKYRPRVFPFARSNEITVRVNGEFVAREHGT